MSKEHPYRSLRLPSDSPFELRPSSPGKGWGAFATRRINRGECILRETPLFFIPKPPEHVTEIDLGMVFLSLTPSEKQQFLLLRDNSGAPFISLTKLFSENSWGSPNRPGRGLLLLHSRFNHSCVPNSKVPDRDDNAIFESFATKDIVAGEEITLCYNVDFEHRTRRERHEALRFTCDCKACLPGTPYQQLSDTRRVFVRALHYLTLGTDVDGLRQGASFPATFEPELKKAAENLSIPLCNRFIYNHLIMVLLEQEGLLDDVVLKKLGPTVVTIATLFQTQSNVAIASLAITQKTWMQRLCIAFNLYGRVDASDEILPERLRELRNGPGGLLHVV